MKNTFCLATALHGGIALPFVIPSEAEGSAVPRTIPGNVFRWSEVRMTKERGGAHCGSDAAGEALLEIHVSQFMRQTRLVLSGDNAGKVLFSCHDLSLGSVMKRQLLFNE
jgi:hypothetical protein